MPSRRLRTAPVHYEVVPAGHVEEIGIAVGSGRLVGCGQPSSGPAVIAHSGGRWVGFLNFSRRAPGRVTVHAVWVSRGYRKRGIARDMLACTAPEAVSGVAVTDAGLRFLGKARAAVGRGRVVDRRPRLSPLDALASQLGF